MVDASWTHGATKGYRSYLLTPKIYTLAGKLLTNVKKSEDTGEKA